MRGDRLDPLRLDRGDGPAPQPRGLDELGGDDPVRRLAGQAGAGEDRELGAAGAEVLGQRTAAALRPPGAPLPGRAGGEHHLHADVGQETGEQGGVNHGPVQKTMNLGVDPEIGGQAMQLAVQVLPLADAQVVEELGAAQAAEGGAGQLALPLGEVVPERDEGEEVRFRLGEAAVRGVGGLLVVGRGARGGPGWTARRR